MKSQSTFSTYDLSRLTSRTYLLLSLAATSLFCASCYSTAEDSEDEVVAQSGTQSVRVVTRTTNATSLQYPIQVYAFDANGTEKAHQTLSSANDNLSFSLPLGSYRVVACSGSLTMPTAGYDTTPVMLGSADVVVGNQPVTVNLLLSYQVSSLSVTLAGLPVTATAVSLAISSQYTQLALTGSFSQPATVTVPLTQSADTWTSGSFYVLPGSGQQTSLSISVVTSSGQQTYGYTYGTPLRAATPYVLQGTYQAGEGQISGILSSGEWNTPVNVNFSFGEGATGGTDTPADDADVSLNGHVVAFADTVDQQVTYMLISLADYTKVHSASADAAEATSIASSYNEGGLTGWRIPTEDEAKRLKGKYYGSTLTTLNTEIVTAGGTEIQVVDAKGENYRYLCAEATKTYQYKSGSSVTQAGSSTTYGLRLVRSVTRSL